MRYKVHLLDHIIAFWRSAGHLLLPMNCGERGKDDKDNKDSRDNEKKGEG
jgi:hypothetical protein